MYAYGLPLASISYIELAPKLEPQKTAMLFTSFRLMFDNKKKNNNAAQKSILNSVWHHIYDSVWQVLFLEKSSFCIADESFRNRNFNAESSFSVTCMKGWP